MPSLSRLSVLGASALLLLLAACGTVPDDGTVAVEAEAVPPGVLKINTSPEQNRIRAAKVEAIAAEVPAAIRDKGSS